ncbi:tigger transposable element-derived protein 1-like [Centruroides sculpturatus]|uniref:tigger transposable element-derived protein 1-like n=1 Tax=Centruroides sculpturatus TaxID=218467 RepID=UPI000C6DB52F|nr:tigger transposable element-derived protein 1-like [Centruroides sculpturatus]
MASKKNRKVISIETKQEIIRRSESGVKQCDLVKQFGLSKTTINTILSKKDAIKSARVAKGVSKIFHVKRRSSLHDEMERLLMVWINDRQVRVDSSTQEVICQKAKLIYDMLKKNTPETSSSSGNEEEEFKASRGWFFRFKKRCGIHSVIMYGEDGSNDKEEAEKFSVDFQQFLKNEGYCPQQVFNANETGLFWKMPNRTFITKEEKTLPGHKPMKDRLTLLFAANASGDLKIKPLLVYHSENPRIFKKNCIVKSNLPVHWKSNQQAWVTQVVFKEWILETFAPAVKKYLLDKELPLKALLILDNAPGHPKDLEEILEESYPFIKVQYLPENTTAILQPMDQQVIANFKKLYTRALFRMVFEECQLYGDMTVRKFWKEKFDVLVAIRLIQKAWGEVKQKTLNSAWKRLVPEWIQEEPAEDTEVVQEIISTARELELEMEVEDVEELIEEHQEELTTEELQALMAQEHEAQREASSDEEEEQFNQPISTAAIKDFLVKWGEVQEFTSVHYPNTAEANRINDLYNDTLARHFRKVLKKREKQTTLDKFFKKPVAKKQRMEQEELILQAPLVLYMN